MKRSVLLSLLVILVMAANAGAAESVRTTFLISKSYDGGIPNGPSRHGAISHDQRIARVLAFESDASNIVQGDTNGTTDVFMIRRSPGWGINGTPWVPSETVLVSVGLGGVPANGPSWAPSIDGASHTKPTCIGFVSAASNLVNGDTNEVADAFVKDLRTGRIERVSVNSKGQQANGETTEISVSGDCRRVAFVSRATNVGLTKTVTQKSKIEWRTAALRGSDPGADNRARRVFVHFRKETGHDKSFSNMTFMASVSGKNRAANADNYEVSFARSGKSVVFTSTATNLDKRDRNGSPDVYRRSFTREYKRVKTGKKRVGVQVLRFETRLVSQSKNGRVGNGPSVHPSITDDGRYVAFETTASNLLPGDTNGVSDIARADLKKKKVIQRWVSKSFRGIGNGASNRPVISGAGEFVLFDSDSTIFKPSNAVADDQNSVRDVFLWNAPTDNTSLESRNWDNKYLTNSSSNPATSSRGNYVLFESTDPAIDRTIMNQSGLQQVYMRYLGPK